MYPKLSSLSDANTLGRTQSHNLTTELKKKNRKIKICISLIKNKHILNYFMRLHFSEKGITMLSQAQAIATYITSLND